MRKTLDVLILVVVEDGLRDNAQKNFNNMARSVLILVVVEDGLREKLEQYA